MTGTHAKTAFWSHTIIDDRRMKEASSLRRCPGRYIGGGAALTPRSALACGPVFNRLPCQAIQGAAREPLAFTIQDIANRLTAVGATEACRVAR